MVKISDIDLPVIYKNQLLFKAGEWNHLSFSNDTVSKSVENTKWSALNKRLYFKHENQYDISQWKGKVENVKSSNNAGVSEVRGDVEIWDANEALQILYGNKPFALSADIEYNDSGVMYFTGFALEADPGVRDVQMFLSDTVKNELNGYYHAKFNNVIDTKPELPITPEISQSQENDKQSAERRLKEKETTKMENNEKQESVTSQNTDLQNKVIELETKLLKLEQRQVESKPVELPKETPKPTVVENAPQVLAQPNVKTLDDKDINSLVDAISERIKPFTQPLTVNEFSGNVKDSEEEVVNRLVENLMK